MPTNLPLEAYDLGDLMGDFPIKKDLLTLALALISAGVLFGLPGLIALLNHSLDILSASFGFCGAVCLVIGLVVLAIFWAGSQTRYAVYQKGIIRIETRRPATIIRWADLSEFHYKVIRRIILTPETFHTYPVVTARLQSRDGTALTIKGNIGKLGALYTLVWNHVCAALVPNALERIEQGKSLEFGGLRVTKTSIGRGPQETDWQLVEGVYVITGDLIVKVREDGKRKDWLKIRTSDIPNLPVLLEVIGDAGPINKLKGSVDLVRDSWFGLGG